MTIHLKPKELAQRLGVSAKTLERWRSLRDGPPYIKFGGRVVYPVTQLEQWEQARTVLPKGL